MDPIFELNLNIDTPKSLPLSERLTRQLKQAITDGRLQYGLRLPASRALASRLQVSRNTIITVYELLQMEGYLATRKGAGTFICYSPLNEQTLHQATANNQLLHQKIKPYWRASENQQVLPATSSAQFDFRPGMPDLRFFPYASWRKQLLKSARQQEKEPNKLATVQGHAGLRKALVRHQSRSRAIHSTAEEILITSGAQQAFDLIARILVVPGKSKIAIESPGYPMIRHLMQSYGATVVPVPVDEQGLRVDLLPNDVDLIYCTASHQFPLGMAMSAMRRQALLTFATAHDALVIEDDYDSEFRLGKHPIDALKSMDKTGNVIYVGTFSKAMLPDLRLGFLIAPGWMITYLCNAKLHTDWHNSWLLQDSVAAFISGGYLEKHLRKMRKLYRQRYQQLCCSFEKYGGDLLQPLTAYAGVHMTTLLPENICASTLAKHLETYNIAIRAIAHFQPQHSINSYGQNGLIFGYGNIDTEDISQGIQRLSEGLAEFITFNQT